MIVKNEFKKLFPILTFDSVKLIIDVNKILILNQVIINYK